MRSPPGKVQTTVVVGGNNNTTTPSSPTSSKIALLRMQHQQILASINNNSHDATNNINNPNLRNKNASPLRSHINHQSRNTNNIVVVANNVGNLRSTATTISSPLNF